MLSSAEDGQEIWNCDGYVDVYKANIIAVWCTAELQLSESEEDRQNINSVITALQKDSDRDVRHLLCNLPDITPGNKQRHGMCNVTCIYHLLIVCLNVWCVFTIGIIS